MPAWLKAIDSAALVLLNVTLAIQVLIVFANTMVRTLFNSSALMGVDETSPLFLITLAFLGGAIAYSRGQFIAITLLVDRAPRAWHGIPEGVLGVVRDPRTPSCSAAFRCRS